jgi:hypothetical protein
MRHAIELKLVKLWLLVLVPTALACGDSGGGEAADADAGVIAADCRSLLAANQTFALAQETGTRSFQTHAYFDGEAIWITHAIVPVGVDSIQIQALRVGCDGSVLHGPTIISPDNSFTHTEPRITGYGDHVMIAWQTDSGGAPNNLSTHYRVFDRSVGPEAASTTHLDTQYKGASAGNTWMPYLAASSGGFAVAGLRGVSDFNSFQSFMQRVDFAGAMVGEAVNGDLQDGLWQGQAGLTLRDSGAAIMAWEITAEDESTYIVQSRVSAGRSSPEAAPVRMSDQNGSQVSFGSSAAMGSYVVSGRASGGLILKPADALDASSSELTLSRAKVALYPQLALGEADGVVAWLENTAGVEAEIYLQGFSQAGGNPIAVGEPQILVTDSASIGAYRLSISHLLDQVFVVTWTEGPVTELQVKWRLVDMSVAPSQ